MGTRADSRQSRELQKLSIKKMHILNIGLYTLKMLNQAVISVEERNNLENHWQSSLRNFYWETAMEL